MSERFVIQKHAATSLHYDFRLEVDGVLTIDAGQAKVWLQGEKLQGGWTLQRTRGGSKPQWLLIKRHDEEADAFAQGGQEDDP